jgi:dTDP-4-dehydrorhamnose reductase
MAILNRKILLLGSNGMLGHMVKKYLEQYYEIEIINHRWPSEDFKTAVLDSNADFLINCIGAIPQRTKDFSINWELPIWLDKYFNGKIIHPATDCEMDNDAYGLSKKRAADYLIESGQRTKMIKASIIGPELNGNASMLYWFLSNKDGSTVNGYSNHMWNGITTYYWAIFSKELIDNWGKYNTRTTLSSNCISKYEMCKLFNKIYNRKIKVNAFETDLPANKCLESDMVLDDINVQLKNMINFYF